MPTKNMEVDNKYKGGQQRFLLIYRAMIPSIRLCGHCQLELLASQGEVEYRAVQEMSLTNDDLNWAEVVVLGRLDSWYEKKLTEILHEAGKYIIYILDDDLLNIPSYISSAAHYAMSETQSNIRSMIAMSDAILSPSPVLLAKYATNGKKAIQIEEPAIKPVEFKKHDTNKPVKIGFAGSIDRTNDIEGLLKDVLLKIKEEYKGRVQFEFFGAIPSFAKELEAKCIHYCNDYDEYRETLNGLEWDIGLAPMPDSTFHACKHYNKFIEYAAAGIVGIYSNVQPYTRLRNIDSKVIFCENNTDAWIEEIRRLIDNREHLEERRRDVTDIAINSLSIAACSGVLKERYSSKNNEKKIVLSLLYLKTFNLYNRIINKVRQSIKKYI